MVAIFFYLFRSAAALCLTAIRCSHEPKHLRPDLLSTSPPLHPSFVPTHSCSDCSDTVHSNNLMFSGELCLGLEIGMETTSGPDASCSAFYSQCLTSDLTSSFFTSTVHLRQETASLHCATGQTLTSLPQSMTSFLSKVDLNHIPKQGHSSRAENLTS